MLRQSKQNENLAKFDEILFNLAQADSIKIHLSSITGHADGRKKLKELEEQAEELIENMRKTFRQLNSFLMTQDESKELKINYKKFQEFESWFKSNCRKDDKMSATSRKISKKVEKLNQSKFGDEQASICDSIDSIENQNDSIHKITYGIKKLKTNSSDIKILDEPSSKNDDFINEIKDRVSITNRMKKRVKKPVVVVRPRKSKSSFPTQYDGSTLLINESEFECYLSDQTYAPKSYTKTKIQRKKENIKITNETCIEDTFKIPLAMDKKAAGVSGLTLRLVKDEELIPLKNFPKEYWKNFSSEYLLASDFIF